jgi:DNA gyrase subunit A
MTKTARILGDTIGKYHPHGMASLGPVVANLVEYGIFDGQGNHGAKYLEGNQLPAGDPRYTEAKLNSNYKSFFDLLLNYVPFKDNYDGKEKEPEYLPTPIPLCLTYGALGIGLGINTRIPAFSFKSLYYAFKNDDPQLLEAPDGLILDKENSELDRLWKTGHGRITYKFKVEFHQEPDAYGVLISGNPLLFLPKLDELEEYVEEGYIFMRAATDAEGKKLFIARNSRVRKISDEEIYDLCEKGCTDKKYYTLNVTDGSNFYTIPLRDWINESYTNYLELLTEYKEDHIRRTEKEIRVTELMPKVVDYLRSHEVDSHEEISEALDIELDIVISIMKKTYNTLMRSESGAQKLIELNKKLEAYKSINEEQKIESIIEEF